MTALNFPSDPSTQTPVNTYSPDSTPLASENGVTYVWDGEKWTATTSSNYLPLSGGTLTGNLTVPSLNGGPLAGLRNQIINGDFRVKQRSQAPFSGATEPNKAYGVDRWFLYTTGAGGNYETSPVGNTDTSTMRSLWYLRSRCTSAASGQVANEVFVQQNIEGVYTIQGEVTLSFWAKGTGTLPGVHLTQNFGAGGSAKVVTTAATNLALTSSWTKYSYTVTLPSPDGKTIPGDDHYIGVVFAVPVNTTWELDLGQVQLEPGPVATPFEHRPIGLELQLCQRYYQTCEILKLSVDTHEPGSATHCNTIVPRTVTMRAAPTTETGTEQNISQLTFNPSTTVINARGRIGSKTAGSFVANYTADAEL